MSTDSEGYVHRPGAVDESSAGGAQSGDVSRGAADAPQASTDDEADGFGRRGWLLVAAVVLGFLVVPGVIYLRPATPADAGLPFITAMLILPLLPAVLLGLTAVWSMSSSARSKE